MAYSFANLFITCNESPLMVTVLGQTVDDEVVECNSYLFNV